jgi:GntR family transcriptional regulator
VVPGRARSALSRDDVERTPFYELLDIELRGATQTIGADSAEADARCSGVPVGLAAAAVPARHHRRTGAPCS